MVLMLSTTHVHNGDYATETTIARSDDPDLGDSIKPKRIRVYSEKAKQYYRDRNKRRKKEEQANRIYCQEKNANGVQCQLQKDHQCACRFRRYGK